MSVTFYVSDWEKQPSHKIKEYITDLYPSLEESDLEHDPFLEKDDDGRHFSLRTVYENAFPELNVCSYNAQLLLEAIGYQYCDSGTFPVEQLSEVISNCMKLLNNKSKMIANERPAYQEGNMVGMGADSAYISEKIQSLMDVIIFAQKNNKEVYWG